MITVIKIIFSAGFLIGVPLAILVTIGYFTYTGSTLLWKKVKK